MELFCPECDASLIDEEVLVCPCCGLENPLMESEEPDDGYGDWLYEQWKDRNVLTDYEKRLNKNDY